MRCATSTEKGRTPHNRRSRGGLPKRETERGALLGAAVGLGRGGLGEVHGGAAAGGGVRNGGLADDGTGREVAVAAPGDGADGEPGVGEGALGLVVSQANHA